jgi:hypothetical protein
MAPVYPSLRCRSIPVRLSTTVLRTNGAGSDDSSGNRALRRYGGGLFHSENAPLMRYKQL